MTREKAVIKKAKQGDLSALDELIRLYYSEIFKYCCWHTKTPEQAEDATQDTFYKAMPDVDNLLTSFYQLDDGARQDVIEMIKGLLRNHRDPDRANDIKNIKL